MYLLCLEIVLTEEGLTEKEKITGKVKGTRKDFMYLQRCDVMRKLQFLSCLLG